MCMFCNTLVCCALGFFFGLGLTRILPETSFDWMGRAYWFAYEESFDIRQVASTHLIPLKGDLRLKSEIELDILFADTQTTDF